MGRPSAALALLAVLAVPGCAFTFSGRAPRQAPEPGTPVACTSGPWLVGLDALCVAYTGALAVPLVRARDCGGASFEQACTDGRNGLLATDLVVGGLCVASGIWGAVNAVRCAEAKDRAAAEGAR